MHLRQKHHMSPDSLRIPSDPTSANSAPPRAHRNLPRLSIDQEAFKEALQLSLTLRQDLITVLKDIQNLRSLTTQDRSTLVVQPSVDETISVTLPCTPAQPYPELKSIVDRCMGIRRGLREDLIARKETPSVSAVRTSIPSLTPVSHTRTSFSQSCATLLPVLENVEPTYPDSPESRWRRLRVFPLPSDSSESQCPEPAFNAFRASHNQSESPPTQCRIFLPPIGRLLHLA